MKAADPTCVPSLGGKHLSAYRAQFLDYVTKNVSEYYICRVPDCAFVGRNCDWADNRKFDGGRYACPRCGSWYRPWLTGSSGRLACNK
eukprot:10704388-Alexandrium_andersonii.AAC.1